MFVNMGLNAVLSFWLDILIILPLLVLYDVDIFQFMGISLSVLVCHSHPQAGTSLIQHIGQHQTIHQVCTLTHQDFCWWLILFLDTFVWHEK